MLKLKKEGIIETEPCFEDMKYYANGLRDYCKRLHSIYVGDNACKNCILSKLDDGFGEFVVCSCCFREPQDWDIVL